VLREPGVVLLAREPLLLGRRNDDAVLDQRGRAVMVIRGNSENAGRCFFVYQPFVYSRCPVRSNLMGRLLFFRWVLSLFGVL